MNVIAVIIEFLKDGSLSFGKKSLVIIFFLGALISLNYFLGFSFNYMINQELNQIEKILKIRNENILSDSLEIEIAKIERKIIRKNNIYSIITDNKIQVDSVYKTKVDTSSIGDIKKIGYESVESGQQIIGSTDKVQEINRFKFLLTSSYGFLIILVLLPFVPFFNIADFWNTLLGTIILIGIDLLLIWLNFKLFNMIPTYDKIWINYLLNLAIHTLFIILIITLSVKISKNRKKNKTN